MKLSDKFVFKVDEATFQPYYEICGKRVYIEPIIDANLLIGKEQTKNMIIEQYGNDVYEAIKEYL